MVRTFAAKQLLAELEEDKARYLANAETMNGSSRGVFRGMAAEVALLLEKLPNVLRDIETEIAEDRADVEPSGWDDGSAAEYDRGPSYETMRDSGRAA